MAATRIRVASLLRSVQQPATSVPLVTPKRTEWNYTSKEGVPREIIAKLTQDYNLSLKSFTKYIKQSQWTALKEDHKFVAERHSILGPDLATAHFMAKRGAKVKFVGLNRWFQQDENGNMYLPNQFVSGMYLEAIDATGMEMTYIAFDNMFQLEQLRYLNFSNCKNFSDWCLAKMHQFQHSLEFLDISGCIEVTENGLACLHCLKKLKGLKLTNLPNVQNMGLMVLLLEESLPECAIFGVEEGQLQLPSGDPDSQLPPRLQGSNQLNMNNDMLKSSYKTVKN